MGQRAKLVIHGGNGWQSANAVEGQALAFRPSEWRRDSRLELIFSEPQDQLELERVAGLPDRRLRRSSRERRQSSSWITRPGSSAGRNG